MICHSPSLAFLIPFAHAPARRKAVRLVSHDQVGGRKMAELEFRYGGELSQRGGSALPWCWFSNF